MGSWISGGVALERSFKYIVAEHHKWPNFNFRLDYTLVSLGETPLGQHIMSFCFVADTSGLLGHGSSHNRTM